ncbi:TPA: DNA-directed RNA polymerase subunit beta' [Candidatus Saccharibacteria bacterium]|nr:DNA-directed RNA polymerase subunit beta' [Candidatus Saccharibacteria bacterium]HIO87414.1 DNA-directed RNA polymerase subunit beta' [Candidatus Saccharibacteria bacterium]
MYAQGYSKDMTDFDAVRLTIASSERILEWSHGEVLKPETINYRTQKPERDGLFCERIFGPVKDINPNDPKYRGIRNREVARDHKGEIVTKSIVRRERMGHISLAAPVTHIWFLRGTPSAVGLILNMTVKNLEKVVYFASYIVTKVDGEARDQMIADLDAEAEAAQAAIKARFEQASKEENADVKELAKQQSKELEDTAAEYDTKRAQLLSLVKKALITEGAYREMPREYRDLVTVKMGGKAIKALLDEIKLEDLIADLTEQADGAKGQRRKRLVKRLKMLEGMQRANIQPKSMIMTALPVIPPDLRPMVQLTGGRFATSDLNDLYRRVINRNNRLKKLVDLKAPEVIQRNEQRMLQEAVDALIDNNASRSGRAVAATGGRRKLKSLSDMLKGKQGRFRQNLLGKRVDYSGRSVIVAGPELNIEQCGLPKMMALELFKPFVIGRLIELDYAHNIKSATRMIESGDAEVWDALDEVIKGKYVLLNRAPTLHRLGIQAFQPVLIEGKAIQLHPLVCAGFNADFDGDQMAVHLPLSDAAQAEARELMTARKNLLKPSDGSPILHIQQDIVLGCYYLTYEKYKLEGKRPVFSDIDEALYAYDQGHIKLQSPVSIFAKGARRDTTLGRVLFNEILPEDFPFQDVTGTKKSLAKIMAKIFAKYGSDVTAEVADELKDLGFEYATASGLSTGVFDYPDIAELDDIMEEGDKRAAEISDQYEEGLITEEERYRLTVDSWRDVDDKVMQTLESTFEETDSSVSLAAISGARGNVGQLKQVTGSLGMVADTTGRIIELPIKNNYKRGLSSLENFISTRGTRRTMIDTALKTADSGYLTRRMVDVVQDVFINDTDVEDPGYTITREETEGIGLEFADRVTGRILAADLKAGSKVLAKAGDLITPDIAEEIDEHDVQEATIRSILTDTSVRGISPSSYGVDMSKSELVKPFTPVGVIAAQSIGEPGTQLTLRTFHAGGVAGEDITQGLPRVDELLEARNPKGQAFLTEIDGKVSIREAGNHYVVQVASDADKAVAHELGDRKVQIKSGSKVKAGDVLADKDGKKPLAAKIDGVAEVYADQIVVIGDTGKVRLYEIPGFKALTVSDGDSVEKGDRLTTGSINVRELMKLKGVLETQRYIITEIRRIFASQGHNIADKHLEIVVNQMFSRVQVDDPGDSSFVIGDIVSKAAIIDENKTLADAGKEPAQYSQLLLGITKVSTWSDSFLSAASFQDTTRVLIQAAVNGRVDNLYGLKENVIIGRKIPVGTGARVNNDQADEVTEVAE